MRIVVCVKQVPDSAPIRCRRPETGAGSGAPFPPGLKEASSYAFRTDEVVVKTF
jgi:hypothetical protein